MISDLLRLHINKDKSTRKNLCWFLKLAYKSPIPNKGKFETNKQKKLKIRIIGNF